VTEGHLLRPKLQFFTAENMAETSFKLLRSKFQL